MISNVTSFYESHTLAGHGRGLGHGVPSRNNVSQGCRTWGRESEGLAPVGAVYSLTGDAVVIMLGELAHLRTAQLRRLPRASL